MNVLALALILAPAWAAAQAPPSLATRIGLEGPLDNDTDVPRNAAAEAALAAGDARLAESKDEATRVRALEEWRRALLESSVWDGVESGERRTISVFDAVTSRLVGDLRAEFVRRFAGIADGALAAAGSSEAALERVAYENPFTRAGLLADLRACDAALERGALAAARAAYERVVRGLDPSDANLRRALEARSALCAPAVIETGPFPALSAAKTLVFESVVPLSGEARSQSEHMLEPGAARAADGRLWIQVGERLVALAPDGTSAIHEPQKLVAAGGGRGTWLPGFGDADRPWLQRPALERTTLALVLGRARESRGNALAAFDVAGETPRLLWFHHDGEGAEDACLPGILEFQPGPLEISGLVIAQVLQWDQGGVNPGAQRVDGRNTRGWLVAFEAHSGALVWKRRLASGSDRRGRALDRFHDPRSTSIASPPLELFQGREVIAATELGVVARVLACDGRGIESYALERVRHDPEIRPGSGGPFVGARSVLVAPSDADEYVYFLGGGPPSVIRVPHLDRVVGLGPEDFLVLVREGDRGCLRRIEWASSKRTDALPFPRGEDWKGGMRVESRLLAVAGGRLTLHSTDSDMRLLDALDLAGAQEERHVGVWMDDARVYVVGEGRIWIVRTE